MKRELKNEQGETVFTIELPETATEADYEKAIQGMGYNLDGTPYKAEPIELTQEDLQAQLQNLLAQAKELMGKLKNDSNSST